MASFLNIGLNVHTFLLIQLLVVTLAFSLSIHADTLRSHLFRLTIVTISLSFLLLVLFSLPHAPLF